MSEADLVEEILEKIRLDLQLEPIEIVRLVEEVERLGRVLEHIRDYDPPEVYKDEFAYDRFKQMIQDYARAALPTETGTGPKRAPRIGSQDRGGN